MPLRRDIQKYLRVNLDMGTQEVSYCKPCYDDSQSVPNPEDLTPIPEEYGQYCQYHKHKTLAQALLESKKPEYAKLAGYDKDSVKK